jgi:hypothetical protein
LIKINSNNIDKNIKMYYNKLNMYTERVLEVPHSGTSFFAEIFKMTKSLRKERKKKLQLKRKRNGCKRKNA